MQHNGRGGQVALPFVLLVAGIIIEIAIAAVFVVFFLSTGTAGERLALRARGAADSGARDAMVKIARDKEFAGAASEASPFTYSLALGNDTADISVWRAVDNTNGVYIYSITAIATADNRKKKVMGSMVVDQITGRVQLQSLAEVPVGN